MNRVGALRGNISILCQKLPNSVDTFKVMVSRYSQKAISGHSNYQGMVTSYKMNKSEIGYRLSKSVLLNSNVKELEYTVVGGIIY